MMASAEGTPGLQVRERLLDGSNFNSALDQYNTTPTQTQKSKSLAINTAGAPDLHFDATYILAVSADETHALAEGIDKLYKRVTLMRDGNPLLEGNGDGISVTNAPDFTRIVAVFEGNSQRESAYLISDGETKPLYEGPDLEVVHHSVSFGRILLTSRSDRGINFVLSKDGGHAEYLFGVNGDFSVPRVVTVNPDYSNVVWTAGRYPTFSPYYEVLLRNHEFLAKGAKIKAVHTSEDGSKTLAIIKDGGFFGPRTKLRAILEGTEIMAIRGANFVSSLAQTDFSTAAIEISERRPSCNHLLAFVRTSDGAVEFSKPYDKLQSLEEVDGRLVAKVTRDNKTYQVEPEA